MATMAPQTLSPLFVLTSLTLLTGSASSEQLANASAKPLAVCASDSAEAKTATAALADLDQQIARLSSAGDAAATAKALGHLLLQPCFELAAENPRQGDVTSATSSSALRTWWQAGGRAWLDSYLHGSAEGRIDPIVLPPDMLDSFVPGDARGAALPAQIAQLTCAANASEECGAEVRGYQRRAQVFFATQSRARPGSCANPEIPADPTCGIAARKRDYVAWRLCLEERRTRVPTLPLGQMRPPREGWLVVSQKPRPPSEKGCAESQAFHVASGSAAIVVTCAGRGTPPDAGTGSRKITTGVVPAAFVREALWMLMLSDRVKLRQTHAETKHLPSGMVPRWPRGGTASGSGCSEGSAHDTIISWQWWSEGQPLLSGHGNVVRDPGMAHAANLFEVLQASFSPAKPALPVPAAVLESIGESIAGSIAPAR
jgi:hypothetical protein